MCSYHSVQRSLCLVMSFCHSVMCSFHYSLFLYALIMCFFNALFVFVFLCTLIMRSFHVLFLFALFMRSYYVLFYALFLRALLMCSFYVLLHNKSNYVGTVWSSNEFPLPCISPHRNRIVDSVLIWENTVKWKPVSWHILRSIRVNFSYTVAQKMTYSPSKNTFSKNSNINEFKAIPPFRISMT